MKNYLRGIIFQKIAYNIFWGLLLLLLLCASLAAGTVANSTRIQKEEKKLPVYSVDTKDRLAALTFNCAWNIDDLDSILGILRKNDIRASFFMTGEWVEQYPEAVKKIQKAEIGRASCRERG